MSRLINDALSMETAKEPVTVTPEQELRTELALESSALELQGLEHQMQMEEYQISELDHAVTSLESIKDSISTSLENNERGLDRVAAEGYQHAIHAVVGDSLPNPIASLESFGGTSQAHRATEVSLEGISDTLKKAWDAFIRAIKKAYETVKDFIGKLFDSADKLSDRMKEKSQAVSDLQGKKPNNDKFEVPKAGQLVLDGSVDTQAIDTGFDRVTQNLMSVIAGVVSTAKEHYETVGKFYTSKPDNLDALKKREKETVESMKEALEKGGEQIFPGNKAIEYEVDTEGDIPSIKPPKMVTASKAKDASETKVAVPEVKWMQDLLSKAGEILKSLTDARKEREKLNDVRKEAANNAEKLIEAQSSNKLAEWWDDAKVRLALRSANRDYARSVAQMDSYIFSYLRALVAYVDAASKAYSSSSQEDITTEGDDDQTGSDDDDKDKGGEGDDE